MNKQDKQDNTVLDVFHVLSYNNLVNLGIFDNITDMETEVLRDDRSRK